MTNHWHALCKARDIVRTKNSLRVTIAGPHAADSARTHTVEVEEVPDGIQLRALVTRLRGDCLCGRSNSGSSEPAEFAGSGVENSIKPSKNGIKSTWIESCFWSVLKRTR